MYLIIREVFFKTYITIMVIIIILSMCIICVGVHVTVCVWSSVDNTVKSFLSFYEFWVANSGLQACVASSHIY